MDFSDPSACVVPSLDGPVLMVLARTTRPLSARAVARLALRGSAAGVNKVLRRLVAQGLVTAQEAEPAVLYRLNRAHLAVPAVEVLADLKNELIRRLRHSISEWAVVPVFASLFGSTARGDGDAGSDIDVFLVRPSEVDNRDQIWWDQVGHLASAVRDWTGNHASIAEVGLDELMGPVSTSIAAVARDIREEGIALFGTFPPELDVPSS